MPAIQIELQSLKTKLFKWFKEIGVDTASVKTYSLEELKIHLSEFKVIESDFEDNTSTDIITALGRLNKGLDDIEHNYISSILLNKEDELKGQVYYLENTQALTKIKNTVSSLDITSQQKAKLETEINASQINLEVRTTQSVKEKEEQWEAELNLKEREAIRTHEIKLRETSIAETESRAKIWQQFLTREAIASTVGAILLLIIVIIIGIISIGGGKTPDILSNILLVIIGFFFGQSTKNQDNK